MRENGNNYETWCEQWRERFLEMNQTELRRRLPELRDEGGALTIREFGRKLAVNKADGRITAPEDGRPVGCTERLNVYTLFGYVSENARLLNRAVPFGDLRNAAQFAKAFENGVTAPFARMFNGRAPALSDALRALGGRQIAHADVGYTVDAFACIPVTFLFWDGDDEFPAQGNILFDESATDFIHVESVVSIASVGLKRLADIAGPPLDPAAFPVS